MFRIFLLKKMLTGDNQSAKTSRRDPRRLRNRRITERYSVDFKHLTMLNDQDIFVVRDISAGGFSTYISKRGSDRLAIGDVYAARMRYVGEIYDLEARVSWKAKNTIGFELVNASAKTYSFLQRLMRPIEIAASLREVDSAFMNENNNGKHWYHGDDDTDLYLWHAETGELISWQLTMRGAFVEWDTINGLRTGSIEAQSTAGGPLNYQSRLQHHDSTASPDKKQLATDILMAIQIPAKEHILPTII